MEFEINRGSVAFEFVYKNYTISIADFIHGGEPDGKISILIQKHGQYLSSKTVARIADYMMSRMDGISVECNRFIELAAHNTDQVMYCLLKAIENLPN